MPRFRKKPVEVEARQLTPDSLLAVRDWCDGELRHRVDDGSFDHCIGIDTLEGTMWAHFGDWVIRGIRGEFYPCKPDIFAATYESVD